MEWLDLLQPPEEVSVQTGAQCLSLVREQGAYVRDDLAVTLEKTQTELRFSICAQRSRPCRVVAFWKCKVEPDIMILGDHWERSYGDLGWRGIDGGRPLPWYFFISGGRRTDGYGVMVQPNALCSWKVSPSGVQLTMDVRCGGEGVLLEGRTLFMASVVSRKGLEGESAFAAAHAFCRVMCPNPRLPLAPVYGGNNWYYAYGESSAEEILADSRLMRDLSAGAETPPCMVVDDGWQISHLCERQCNADPWLSHPEKFPDMAALAEQMKQLGVRPGLWFRPLITTQATPSGWLLDNPLSRKQPQEGLFLDPSRPEVLAQIAVYVKRFRSWGFTLLKHDFSTYDIFGRWGNAFGDDLTESGWHFADERKTTAEVVLGLYRTIRESAGDVTLIGCNTLSHLSAGIFELQRTGDDTSGKDWTRTVRMGVNTLAFRMPQHRAFYAVDADCVGLTREIDWSCNRQWLDLLAKSGTPLFVSADPKAMGEEQRKAVREAFAMAAKPVVCAEPVDWKKTMVPNTWKTAYGTARYDWGMPAQNTISGHNDR